MFFNSAKTTQLAAKKTPPLKQKNTTQLTAKKTPPLKQKNTCPSPDRDSPIKRRKRLNKSCIIESDEDYSKDESPTGLNGVNDVKDSDDEDIGTQPKSDQEETPSKDQSDEKVEYSLFILTEITSRK